MKQSLHIAIIGTRGIPNNYGGFEQFAQYLSVGLVSKGHRVAVYNSHDHPYQEKEWQGAEIIHCFDAEKYLGTAGQFIYDLNCIRNARRRQFDVILFLGYTSSSVWGRLFPTKAVIISNMDGMEWKRTKYSSLVRKFLQYAERLAVKYSHHLIADSTAIQTYLEKKYAVKSEYIPYGAALPGNTEESLLKEFGLNPSEYYMLMARMEPENNIDMILEGFCRSGCKKKFIVVGNRNNAFGKKMHAKYAKDERVYFAGAIFDQAKLNALRSFCCVYFHGHSVGGTNPSLLEAMAATAVIAAHNNEFNSAVLQRDAFYFNNANDVLEIINNYRHTTDDDEKTGNNLHKIETIFNWPAITDSYAAFMTDCCNRQKK